jgi:hypothetical protein
VLEDQPTQAEITLYSLQSRLLLVDEEQTHLVQVVQQVVQVEAAQAIPVVVLHPMALVTLLVLLLLKEILVVEVTGHLIHLNVLAAVAVAHQRRAGRQVLVAADKVVEEQPHLSQAHQLHEQVAAVAVALVVVVTVVLAEAVTQVPLELQTLVVVVVVMQVVAQE